MKNVANFTLWFIISSLNVLNHSPTRTSSNLLRGLTES